MKSERRTNQKKKEKSWTPRIPALIPPNKRMKSKKDYDRRDGRRALLMEVIKWR